MIDSIKYVGLSLTKHFGLLCNNKCSMCTVLPNTVSSAAIVILPSRALITEQYWHSYTESQMLASGCTCQSRWALGSSPIPSSGSLSASADPSGGGPELPATPPATQVNSRPRRVPQGPQNYHKGFSGQMPSPTLAWADHSHLARLTHDHHDQLSHLH